MSKKRVVIVIVGVILLIVSAVGFSYVMKSNSTEEIHVEVTPEVTPEATPEVTPEATPEVTPEVTLEKISATIFVTDRQKKVTFYPIQDERYLKKQSFSVAEKENIDVNLYLPELDGFIGCEIVRADNQPLDSESIHYVDIFGKEETDAVPADLLQAGGSVQLRGLKEKTYYRIFFHTKSSEKAEGQTYGLVLTLI